MWNLSLPWWEFVLRAIVTYVFLIILLRLTGKRQIGQMSPFDFVLLLVLSNAVQNSMNGGDNSVLGGMILAATLVVCNGIVSYITFKNRALEQVIDGEPTVLIFKGKLIKKAVDEQQLSMAELEGAMRVAGCEKVSQVHLAMLEVNGQISVVREDDPDGEKHRVYQVPSSRRRKGRRYGFGI